MRQESDIVVRGFTDSEKKANYVYLCRKTIQAKKTLC